MEIDVVALLLYYYIEEYDNFKRDEDRWRKVFSYETKLLVRQELSIEDYTLQNALSSLRKKKVVVDNEITSYYVPKINKDTEHFMVIFDFKLNA